MTVNSDTGVIIEQCRAPVSEGLIHAIMEVERAVYTEENRGEFHSIMERVQKAPDMLLLARDGEKLVGYLCYFPISDSLYRDMMKDGRYHDDDIRPEDVVPFSPHTHLFLISIAILPKYQNTGLADRLMGYMEERLTEQARRGNRVEDILAAVVTPDGEKLARRYGFRLHYDGGEDYKIFWRKGWKHEE